MPPVNELIANVVFGLFMAVSLVVIVWLWLLKPRQPPPPPPARPMTRRPAGPMMRAATALGDVVSGVGGCLGVILGMIAALLGGLVMLYIAIWILKRLWEAA